MKRISHFIPITILVSAVLYSLYAVNTTNIILGTKQHIGIAFVIGDIILIFVRRELGIYLTGVSLLLGTLNIIAFTPMIESYSFGFSFSGKNGIDFQIQLFSFLVLLIYLVVSYKRLLVLIRRPSKT
jgi:hypothetical protein